VVETGADRPQVGTSRRALRGSDVQVRLSSAGREALARSQVAGRVLDRVTEALGLEKDALDAAGREEYLESIATPANPAAADAAGPVLGGILGFVYDAFRLENPDPSRHELRGFVARAVQGTDRGMRDAMDLLRAFSAREAELEAERARTLQRVREALESFADASTSPSAERDGSTPPPGVTTSPR
jgi:hypothetical protein